MDTVVYVCTGTCEAEISEEEYKNGLTKCGTSGALFEEGTEHKH